MGSTTADGSFFIEKLFVEKKVQLNDDTLHKIVLETYPNVDPEPILALYPEEKYRGKTITLLLFHFLLVSLN